MGTSLPQWVLPHTATIEPFRGNGAYGPVYEPPIEDEPCLIDDERRMVRDDEGTEVVSDTTIFFLPGTRCPAGSRITANGRQMIAITSFNRDGGRLPTPDHVEVVCK
ncbi:hypothetical protein ABT158_03745 [Nonomuraea sp. NPDC001636]|uniref:hypothetical protein n=1 Tax=unclassified Nonomuraea TaxID=2593643 RepID=UPI003332BEB3